MIKIITMVLLFILIQPAANALDNCATTDAQVNLSIPCVEYQGEKYTVILNAISHNKGGFPLCWILADGVASASDTSNCATADTDLNVQLPCVSHENSNFSVVLNSNSPQNSDDQCQWLLGEATESQNGGDNTSNTGDSNEPVLYIVSMMHAEDSIRFDTNEAIFQDFASGLRRVSELLLSHGAKLDFGPDWTFLTGVINYDNSLLTEILAAGHGVHTHAHETSYNESGQLYDLGVVNQLLAQAGASGNKVANGGFVQSGANGSNWVGYVTDFKDGDGQQLFDIIIGYKDPQTQIPDTLGYVIQPSTAGSNWQLQDSQSSILYAGSNMPPFPKAGALDFSTIRSWIDKRLEDLQPNQINTLYWHDTLHNYGIDDDTTARLLEWENFLNEYLDPKVAAGKIKWATFTEMAELYKTEIEK